MDSKYERRTQKKVMANFKAFGGKCNTNCVWNFEIND